MSTISPAAPNVEYDGDLPLTARNAGLGDLANMLRDQHARKVDVVAPATAVRSEGGVWRVSGAEPILTPEGVTDTAGRYRPTRVADEGLASRLGVPTAYLRRLREERPDLYDATVNGLLHGGDWHRHVLDEHGVGPLDWQLPPYEPDERSFLLRAFQGQDGPGIARAFLSDRYRIVDNLDVLTAALDGVRQADADVEVEACDLTERRMMVRVAAPSIAELAPDLLGGYRSPFTGATGADNPAISAGLVISNSEVGGGAFTITPRLRVEVCSNGMTVTRDAHRAVHLGGKMEEGVVRWSDDTQRRNLDLVTSQARDAVATFLDVDYLRRTLSGIRERAGTPVEKPQDTVERVATNLRYGQDAADAILSHFIEGGQRTAGGVMQAVTSWAQTLPDAEDAADVEASALDALALAAAE